MPRQRRYRGRSARRCSGPRGPCSFRSGSSLSLLTRWRSESWNVVPPGDRARANEAVHVLGDSVLPDRLGLERPRPRWMPDVALTSDQTNSESDEDETRRQKAQVPAKLSDTGVNVVDAEDLVIDDAFHEVEKTPT